MSYIVLFSLFDLLFYVFLYSLNPSLNLSLIQKLWTRHDNKK